MAVFIHQQASTSKVASMTTPTNKQNVKNYLFSRPIGKTIPRREKDLIREQLNRDVEAWLAAGNVIDDRGEATNDTKNRQVRHSAPGTFQ